MPDVTMVFHIHRSRPLLRRRVQDAGTTRPIFDEFAGRADIERRCRACYDPAFELLGDVARTGFRIGLAVSGSIIERLARHAPVTLEKLQRLAAEPAVELVGQTYQQSLAELGDVEEFIVQVERHRRAVAHYFGRGTGSLFRGTGLHLSPAQVPLLRRLGFGGALVRLKDDDALRANGAYGSSTDRTFALLPRNDRLSDDLAWRFSDRSWDRWPLTADTFAMWIAASPGSGVHLDVDIGMFGAVHPAASGIFEFMRRLPGALARHGVTAITPSERAGIQSRDDRSQHPPQPVLNEISEAIPTVRGRLAVHALRRFYGLRQKVRDCGGEILEAWSRLTCADYLLPMLPEAGDGGPFRSRFDAYMSFMNVLDEIEAGIATHRAARNPHPGAERRPAVSQPGARESTVHPGADVRRVDVAGRTWNPPAVFRH